MHSIKAEEGYRSGLTSELTFAVTVWALLIATLISPIAFRRALRQAATKDENRSDIGSREKMGKLEDLTRRNHRDFEVAMTPTRAFGP
jgi:hypothetical protein